jgi:hypothetical protein
MYSDPQRSSLALSLLNIYPPLIRKSIMSDPVFRTSYDLKIEAQVTFGDKETVFLRSKLFQSIKELLSDRGGWFSLKDIAGEEWSLKIHEEDKKRFIEILRGERRFLLPNIYALSPDQSERLNDFEIEADEVNFPIFSRSAWQKKLSFGPLEDEEVASLQKDLNDTPTRVAAAIITQIEKGSSDISSLVPTSEKFYSRLIGEFPENTDVSTYSHRAREHFLQLFAWRPYDGFLLSLLLSSHPSFPLLIPICELKESDLVHAYEWLAKYGDRTSQIGAVEIWLSSTFTMPQVECYIHDIIMQIENDNDIVGGRLSLFSALVVLIEGELARTKILSGKPVFYRRLASIAHASLIERCLVSSNLDNTDFIEWAVNARGQFFYLQSMIDLRREPRWDPEYISPHQLKDELTGRIFNAAQKRDLETNKSILRDLLAGEHVENFGILKPSLSAFLPGPLEGGFESQNEPPPEVLSRIEDQLKSNVLESSSFTALVNSALFFRIDSYQAQLAAKALRSVKHQIKKGDNKELIFPVLRGLAKVAAVTRSEELARELQFMTRKCRNEPGRSLSAEEAMWIGLIAAASYSDLTRWCDFVGEWVTELAFQPSQHEEMGRLYSHLKKLLQLVPELWLTCGRAEAAMSSTVGQS